MSCLKNRIRNRFFSSITNLPSSADVVIIGGGISGSNTLYQLAKRNVKTVLIEKNKISNGTSSSSAGLICSLRPNDTEIKLLDATKKVFKEIGTESSWVQTGGLYIAHCKERLQEFERLHTIGHYFGIESEIFSPEEATKLFPLLKKENFYAAFFTPADGTINTEILCNSLIRKAIIEGYGKIIENCSVKNILTSSITGARKITGIKTSKGVIKTNHVINCTGIWSKNVMNSIGIDIPILPIEHTYVITDQIAGLRNNLNIHDCDSSIYFRIANSSIYIGGFDNNTNIIDNDDYKLDNLNSSKLISKNIIEKVIKICPQLNKINLKTTQTNFESFTPDRKPILGEDPLIKGLYHNCGYNSFGAMLGGGCAEQLAYWILNGRPKLNMSKFDIRRFSPLMRRDSNWIKERSRESYTNIYKIAFPHDHSLTARGLVTDVFYENLVASGAFMEERNGWEKPGYFLKNNQTVCVPKYDFREDNADSYIQWMKKDYTFGFSEIDDIIKDEVMHCRKTASIFNLSYFTKLYLTGPEAAEAAEWLFTANINDFEPEDYVYTFMLNKNGNVEADLNVMTLNQGIGTLIGPILKGRGYYIVAGGILGYNVLAHIKQQINQKGFRAVITDVTNRMGILSIQGPKSREILQGVTETPITDDQFPLATSRLISIEGEVCRAIRTSFIGELGFQLHIPVASCAPVYKKLNEIGSNFQMKNAGFRALYVLNCEKGKHLWGLDLRMDDNPIEANLGHYCRLHGNYLGKKIVDSIRFTGTFKLRAIFTIDKKLPMFGLETIWRDDIIIGYLRRAHYGYNIEKSIGIGYIEHPRKEILTEDFLKSGNYQIEVMGKKYEAKIHLKTIFDQENLRMRGIYENSLNELSHFDD